MALMIFETFKGHTNSEMRSLLSESNILSVIVPSNCTDALQSLDLSINKPLKGHLRSKFQCWYSEQVSKQIDDGKQPNELIVDTKLSVMRTLSDK